MWQLHCTIKKLLLTENHSSFPCRQHGFETSPKRRKKGTQYPERIKGGISILYLHSGWRFRSHRDRRSTHTNKELIRVNKKAYRSCHRVTCHQRRGGEDKDPQVYLVSILRGIELDSNRKEPLWRFRIHRAWESRRVASKVATSISLNAIGTLPIKQGLTQTIMLWG